MFVAAAVALAAEASAQGGGGGRPGMVPGGQPRAERPGAVAQEQEPTGTARIRGQVLAADTGAPLRRAQVRASASEIRVNRLVSTDAQGRYELKDLPAGRYQIAASKAGFVALAYGQRRPNESGRPIDIADGQSIDRVEFRLPRGSAIMGRISDEFGEPVANARVQTMRYQFFQGQRRLMPAGGAGGGGGDQTDDRGEYRLFGLPPGDYYVTATLRTGGFGGGFGPGGPAESEDPMAYAPTYFPGTTNVAEAQRVTLGVGEEHANTSFALSPTRTVKVSGTVLGADGDPMAGGIVMLTDNSGPAARLMAMGGGGRIREDGSFTIGSVAPGSYLLQARNGGGRASDDAQFASMAITITGGDDVTGVTLVATRGGTVSGAVVMEPGSTGTLQMSRVQVSMLADRADMTTFGAPPRRVEDDGTFRVIGLVGRRLFRVIAPAGWSLKSVLMDGSDITDTPIEFKGGEDLSGVQIVLTDRVTEVSGAVTTQKGDPTRDFTVVVFPDDDQKWYFQSRYITAGRPDQDGRYKIRGLPAYGNYLVVAVDYLENGEAGDPEFLERVRAKATKLSLADGETTTLGLKVVTER